MSSDPEDAPETGGAALRWRFSERQGRLQHGLGVCDVVDFPGESAATGILIPDRTTLAVEVDRARVFGVECPRILLPHQFLHHREHLDLALVQEHFGVLLIGHSDPDIAIVHVTDAVPGSEIAAHRHRVLSHLPRHAAIERYSVCRAPDDVNQALPPGDVPHDLSGSSADRRGRIVRMESQPDAGLDGHWDDCFQEVGDVVPHFFEAMGPFVRKRRQVFDLIVVESRHSGACPAYFLVIALYESVRVEVVFDHGETRLAGRADGLYDLVYLLVAAWPSIEGVAESRDHHVTQRQAGGLESLYPAADAGLLPRNPGPLHEDIIHTDLFQPPHPGLIGVLRDSQADLGSVGAFGGRPRDPRLGKSHGRQSCRTHCLHHPSSGYSRAHDSILPV